MHDCSSASALAAVPEYSEHTHASRLQLYLTFGHGVEVSEGAAASRPPEAEAPMPPLPPGRPTSVATPASSLELPASSEQELIDKREQTRRKPEILISPDYNANGPKASFRSKNLLLVLVRIAADLGMHSRGVRKVIAGI